LAARSVDSVNAYSLFELSLHMANTLLRADQMSMHAVALRAAGGPLVIESVLCGWKLPRQARPQAAADRLSAAHRRRQSSERRWALSALERWLRNDLAVDCRDAPVIGERHRTPWRAWLR
jgi:hypothetical protein